MSGLLRLQTLHAARHGSGVLVPQSQLAPTVVAEREHAPILADHGRVLVSAAHLHDGVVADEEMAGRVVGEAAAAEGEHRPALGYLRVGVAGHAAASADGLRRADAGCRQWRPVVAVRRARAALELSPTRPTPVTHV